MCCGTSQPTAPFPVLYHEVPTPCREGWLCKCLHHLRETKHRTQEQVAEAAGVSWRYLQELEAGRGTNPSLTVLCGLKAALDCSWDELLAGMP